MLVLALPHLRAAWQALRHHGSEIADLAQVSYGLVLLRLGRIEEFGELIQQAHRPGPYRLAEPWRAICEAWGQARKHPGQTHMLCGIVSLVQMARAMGIEGVEVEQLLAQSRAADQGGFTLARLKELAQENGMEVEAVFRNSGAGWIVPAVVHLKADSWRVVLAPEGEGFWVYDPSCGKFWMSEEALEEDMSGFCLVPTGPLPAGWSAVDPQQATQVIGHSWMPLISDQYDELCLPAESGDCEGCGPSRFSGGTASVGLGGTGFSLPNSFSPTSPELGIRPPLLTDPAGGCTSCGVGMPQWSISEPFINLWLFDEPWGYRPPVGPAVRLGLLYKLRDGVDGVNGEKFYDPTLVDICSQDLWVISGIELIDPVMGPSFGPGWWSRWFTYVIEQEGETQTHVIVRTPGRGMIDMYLSTDQTESELDFYTRTKVCRVYDEQNQQIGWALRTASGEVYTYALKVAADSSQTAWIYFLTQYTDRTGSLQFEYQVSQVDCGVPQSIALLTQIVDAQGRVSTLSYGNSSFPNRITAITDPWGRTAHFTYDSDGYLVGIEDVAGMTTTLAYAPISDASPPMLSQMTTPYGTTSFSITEIDVSRRGIVVTMPDMNRVVALYEATEVEGLMTINTVPDEGTLPISGALETCDPGWARGSPNEWNSFYWGPAQAAYLSTTNLANLTLADLKRARIRHWLRILYPNAAAPVLSWEQDPSLDGTTDGDITWFGYEGKPENNCGTVGSSIMPALIARVMPDGTTWWRWYQRNEWGRTTQLVERWIDPEGVEQRRTNTFYYASNGIDLVAVIGPDGTCLGGYAYEDPNHPRLPTAFTNALGEVTHFSYDSLGRLTGVSYPSGHNVTYSYGSDGYLQERIDFIGSTPIRTNSYTWLNGQLCAHTDPRGWTRVFSFNALGQLQRIDYPDGTYEQFCYTNGAGVQLLDVTAYRDRLGHWTYLAYTPTRRIQDIIDPLGRQTHYEWCGCGGPASITRAYGTSLAETTTFEYDARGRLTKVTHPDGSIETFTYDSRDLLRVHTTYWTSLTNTYDNLGRLIRVENAAGVLQARGYDLYDRLSWYYDAQGPTTRSTSPTMP